MPAGYSRPTAAAAKRRRRGALSAVVRAPLPAHLSDAECLALRTIAARLGQIDARIKTLILFGSRARGGARWDSDLDLAVRVRGRRDATLERRIIVAIADVEWSPPLDGALRISSLVCFEGERRAAIHEAIAEEGVTVWQTRA